MQLSKSRSTPGLRPDGSRATLGRSRKNTPLWVDPPSSSDLPCSPQIMDFLLAAHWALLMRLPLGAISSPLVCVRVPSFKTGCRRQPSIARPKPSLPAARTVFHCSSDSAPGPILFPNRTLPFRPIVTLRAPQPKLN